MPVLPARSSMFACLDRLFEFPISPHDALVEGEVVHHICFAPSQCNLLFLGLLPVFSVLGVLGGRTDCIFPRPLVGVLTSPLTDVVVENPRLRQKGDLFGHHHGIRDGISFCLRKLYPLFQLFYQSGKGFCRVAGPHHIHCLLLNVDFVDHPVDR